MEPAALSTRTAAGIAAIVPSTIDQVDSFAKRLLSGKYPIPAWITAKGNPEATVSTIILRGLSLGMEPFTALEAFYEIKGRMGLYASAMAARVLASGVCEGWSVSVEKGDAADKVVAVCRGKRKGMQPFEVRYSFADAERAGYVAQNAKYKSDPKAMLKARAIAIACRENFPDVLRGMNYAAEEIEDFVEVGVVEKSTPPDAPKPGEGTVEQKAPRRRTAPAKKAVTEPEEQPEPEVIDAEFSTDNAEPEQGDDALML